MQTTTDGLWPRHLTALRRAVHTWEDAEAEYARLLGEHPDLADPQRLRALCLRLVAERLIARLEGDLVQRQATAAAVLGDLERRSGVALSAGVRQRLTPQPPPPPPPTPEEIARREAEREAEARRREAATAARRLEDGVRLCVTLHEQVGRLRAEALATTDPDGRAAVTLRADRLDVRMRTALSGLRVGRDRWSRLGLTALRAALPDGVAEPTANSRWDQAVVLRWMLRGLPGPLAIEKTWMSEAAGEKAHAAAAARLQALSDQY